MTPVYINPSHVDNNKGNEHFSHVFDAKHPGLLIATFYGNSHKENAIHFCRIFGIEKTDA